MIKHYPVLLQESINALKIKSNGIYIDGTCGYGGHSKHILNYLSQSGKLFLIDKDIEAINYIRKKFFDDKRIYIYHGSFADIKKYAIQKNIFGKVDGILLDLGVSSQQLDNPYRGFSFIKNGPLDMRMNTKNLFSAYEFINNSSIFVMENIFRKYGEEENSLKIAQAIFKFRTQCPITKTEDLSKIIKTINKKWKRNQHPATKIFQAIRIHVNNELNDLKIGLKSSLKTLKISGRIAIISFHSLECKIINQLIKQKINSNYMTDNFYVNNNNKNYFKLIGFPIKPSYKEIRKNFRSRNAKLWIGEKEL